MNRLIVAFENKAVQAKIVEMLDSGGLAIRCCYHSGAEVMRAINQIDSGVIVCGYKLRDMTAESLSHDLGDSATMLVVAPNSQLELCDSDEIFTLPTPVSANTLCGSVRMLLQMEQRRRRQNAPKRSEEDKIVINRAKQLLMDRDGISEDFAHHMLQKASMDSGIPIKDLAQQIIDESEPQKGVN
jgi:response regulator NasT